MHRAAPYCYTGMKSRRSIGGKVWSGGSRGKEDYHGKHRNRGRQGCHNPLHAFARSHIFWWHLILGVGVVLSARSDFGAPAFQSIPLVFSESTHLLTLGQSCICLYCIDILIQVLVFRTLNVKIALQIPFAFAFGCLIDLFDFVLGLDFFWFCHDPSLLTSCIMFTIGITLIGIGVSAMVAMNFVLKTADGCAGLYENHPSSLR